MTVSLLASRRAVMAGTAVVALAVGGIGAGCHAGSKSAKKTVPAVLHASSDPLPRDVAITPWPTAPPCVGLPIPLPDACVAGPLPTVTVDGMAISEADLGVDTVNAARVLGVAPSEVSAQGAGVAIALFHRLVALSAAADKIVVSEGDIDQVIQGQVHWVGDHRSELQRAGFRSGDPSAAAAYLRSNINRDAVRAALDAKAEWGHIIGSQPYVGRAPTDQTVAWFRNALVGRKIVVTGLSINIPWDQQLASLQDRAMMGAKPDANIKSYPSGRDLSSARSRP